ncbi:tyrosine phosphatase type IVA 3 [Solea senegalensis]|uniref:Protein tyrosine phosphatase type IVA 3 n=2 Tax=Solea senegalensis TaxID=28829 RepID=A0AAV6PPV2_SOLSE|nr:tyrosine phosphatase type IVA 3 [Solea senegalensis]
MQVVLKEQPKANVICLFLNEMVFASLQPSTFTITTSSTLCSTFNPFRDDTEELTEPLVDGVYAAEWKCQGSPEDFKWRPQLELKVRDHPGRTKVTLANMNRPAPVELSHKNMRFLITHNPTDSTLSSFIEDLKRYGATTVVRVCDITYDKTPLEKDGINVVDWPFDDGAPPPSKLVDDWLSLLKKKFQEDPGCCVAVHCVAGLGRAPVLVALALIESGMKYEDAIQLIRQKRRGAINSKQLTYLEKYRSKQRLRFKESHAQKNKCCTM